MSFMLIVVFFTIEYRFVFNHFFCNCYLSCAVFMFIFHLFILSLVFSFWPNYPNFSSGPNKIKAIGPMPIYSPARVQLPPACNSPARSNSLFSSPVPSPLPLAWTAPLFMLTAVPRSYQLHASCPFSHLM